LRLYNYVVKKRQIEKLSTYIPEMEFEMPDKYSAMFVELGLVKLILDDLNIYARANVKKNLCRVLTYLSTHRDCKAYILRYNGMERALEMAQDSNYDIKFEALRLL